jgi:hypothetical protein
MYVKILEDLRRSKVAFRVLGLSATPGRDYNAVQVGGGGRGQILCCFASLLYEVAAAWRLYRHSILTNAKPEITTPNHPDYRTQEVIRNLGVRRVLYLDESDPQLAPYTFEKTTELMVGGRGQRHLATKSLPSACFCRSMQCVTDARQPILTADPALHFPAAPGRQPQPGDPAHPRAGQQDGGPAAGLPLLDQGKPAVSLC